MGNICTRNCAYCNVRKGIPKPLDASEPEKILRAAKELGLSYVVLTTVTRDDLIDGGARHIAKTIELLKKNGFLVEIISSDLSYNIDALNIVLNSSPNVFALNLETTRNNYPVVRSMANYDKILEMLKIASRRVITKTSLIVGLGESMNELKESIRDIANSNVQILMIGQYLRPSKKNIPVRKIYSIEEFKELERFAISQGLIVYSSPLVRTSFRAFEAYQEALKRWDS